jgi:hypothetical protein
MNLSVYFPYFLRISNIFSEVFQLLANTSFFYLEFHFTVKKQNLSRILLLLYRLFFEKKLLKFDMLI